MSAQRFKTKEKAAIEFYKKNGTLIANLRDLSVTGACIEWSQAGVPVMAGDLIRMTVILRALNKKHYLSAEVVWVEGNTGGVTFIKPEKVLEKMIE